MTPDALERFAEDQRRIQGASRSEDETIIHRPPPPSPREVAASPRAQSSIPITPRQVPQRVALEELEHRALQDVLRLTHFIAQIGETQTQLVAQLRSQRPAVICTNAVVDDLERAARAALDECAPLNLNGRVDVIARALQTAWQKGVAAARGEP